MPVALTSAARVRGRNRQAEQRPLARLRLRQGGDAPEKGQPWGQKAKQALSDLCFGSEVTARIVTTDRYGRTVARIYQGSRDINAELVREGAVWVYRKYLTDASLLPIETEARAARRGLWSLPAHDHVPPWEWRRARAP
ncbi:MAG: thermonuclease family protein [Burkholderiales bacterium]|nr:thermonuclease family protein [Burkholderiales bacterium]